ncbi:MAG: DUF559 domain-containing protein [Propionicimonas sp.]|uniref:DUF559 domain-containing protein n=1 Tax=Propionicimonas sp. TaxID=1955623 RepID=UPI003D13ADFC
MAPFARRLHRETRPSHPAVAPSRRRGAPEGSARLRDAGDGPASRHSGLRRRGTGRAGRWPVCLRELRLRLATFDELTLATRALAGSRGHAERVRAITACEGNPWSYAELRLHRILREAGFRDWVGNRPLDIGGSVFHPDARFRAARVIIEVDGRETHDRAGPFRRDRETQNVYIAAGYLVIRFTWEHLDDVDYVVRVVREVLRLRGC